MKKKIVSIVLLIICFNRLVNNYHIIDIYRRIITIISPYREKINICYSLQNKISDIISPNSDKWSITVLNDSGKTISDINGKTLRIPASNQKILTTAYALDRLGPNFTLKTKLYFINGSYHILGEGDPDLSPKTIRLLSNKILSHSRNRNLSTINVYLYEESRDNWWHSSWPIIDRKETYGAPISRLAVQSNSSQYALSEPILFFKSILFSNLNRKNNLINIQIRKSSDFEKNILNYPIFIYNSAPFYSLLSLANSESHNFTSEILLKRTSNKWSFTESSNSIYSWLGTLPLPKDRILIKDGSGLSRSNRLTSNYIANLLFYMKKHKYSNYYLSSFSLYGLRGTLTNSNQTSFLNGKLLAKTGTLSGIKSISGYLLKDDHVYIISIISNGIAYPNSISDQIIKNVYSSDCI